MLIPAVDPCQVYVDAGWPSYQPGWAGETMQNIAIGDAGEAHTVGKGIVRQ